MDLGQEPNGGRSWRRVVAMVCLAIVLIPVTLTITMVISFAIFGCREGPGSSTLSRDGKFAASEYYRSCRGKTPSMEVSIHSSDSLPHGPGNVFSVDLVGATAEMWPMMALWSDSGLNVRYDPRVQIRVKRREFQGIRIFYVSDTIKPPRR